MLDHLDNTPLAARAREAILEAILNHSFESDRLPPEDELAKMLNISRTTIRTALHSLEQDGIVTRRRAVGTTINRHVRPATMGLQRLIGFDSMLEDKGYEARIEVQWRQAPMPAEHAAVFDLDPDEECYTNEKRFYADDQVAIYDRDVVLTRYLRDDIPEDAPPNLFTFSQTYMTAPIDHALVEIVPLVKRRGVSTKLALPTGTPFLRMHERHYSRTGEPLAYSILDIDDSFIRFEVFRHK